ncbi:MAG TPA: hypothetical protein VF189_01360 [Patescibacteria group bacterium]
MVGAERQDSAKRVERAATIEGTASWALLATGVVVFFSGVGLNSLIGLAMMGSGVGLGILANKNEEKASLFLNKDLKDQDPQIPKMRKR